MFFAGLVPELTKEKRRRDVWHWIFDAIGAAILFMAGHSVGWRVGWNSGYNDVDWKPGPQQEPASLDK
jgi:hypothetical protein